METRWLYQTPETIEELREASGGVCVIPMGCVEKHGLHMPVGTDIIIASNIAYAASQQETFCVFPDFTFGDIPGKVPYTLPYGSVPVTLETQMLLLGELCTAISDNGFKKILVYNGHGGNFWLTAFARNLRHKDIDFVFATTETGYSLPHEIPEYLEKHGRGSIPELTAEDEDLLIKYHEEDMFYGHACIGESAYVMDLVPHSMRLDRLGIEDGQSTHKADKIREAGMYIEAGFNMNYPHAYGGDDPVGLNERIARAATRFETERLIRTVKVFKEDNSVVEYNAAHRWK